MGSSSPEDQPSSEANEAVRLMMALLIEKGALRRDHVLTGGALFCSYYLLSFFQFQFIRAPGHRRGHTDIPRCISYPTRQYTD
jgi:hypothetical protein